ncbi:MAG: beta-ketoacyl synthase [Prevotellaceae bacterium]|jgi:3-oxoacyl-[acyl-carrier-protein] synthase-1|nr:beta-ketoacyl synthase [Prevotellaceae bacterium]
MERIKRVKVNISGTNIISSLGFTTEENFRAVKSGISGIKHYDAGTFDLPEAFVASLIDKERLNDCFLDTRQFTDLEKACVLSIVNANFQANIDLSSEKTIFILSTTKGNVNFLGQRPETRHCGLAPQPSLRAGRSQSPVYLWHTAKIISRFFGNPNTPLVVSNACISGAAAQVAALRELSDGLYDNVVVTGADFLSKFIISGFQSFKALSPELCKPFDKDRCGLNLGEAAATIIFQTQDIKHKTQDGAVSLVAGAIRNDATHISAPSRTGEGCYRALNHVLKNLESEHLGSCVSFINAHGTATAYNDAMEVFAIARAGLADVPVNSLKAFFGHTLGAAGVLESIISMQALQENLVLKSLNFKEQNFENQINISKENHFSDKKYFIKLLSGFGGLNAALLFEIKR